MICHLSVYLNVHQINWTLTSRAAPVREFHLEIQVAIRRGDAGRKSSLCATIYLLVTKGVVDDRANVSTKHILELIEHTVLTLNYL